MTWYKFRAFGHSMLPLIQPDQIVYVCIDEQRSFEVGDIVVFRKQTFRCHRIVKKLIINGQQVYVTKGDNNSEIDNFFVTENEIIGHVSIVNPSVDGDK